MWHMRQVGRPAGSRGPPTRVPRGRDAPWLSVGEPLGFGSVAGCSAAHRGLLGAGERRMGTVRGGGGDTNAWPASGTGQRVLCRPFSGPSQLPH